MDTKDDEQTVSTEGSESVVQEEKAIASKPKKHWSDKKKKFVLWGGVGLASILIIVALVVGFMAVVFKLPGQKVVIVPNVCGDTVINNYNTIMTDALSDENETTIPKLVSLVSDIQKNSAYKSDSNCLFISYQTAYFQKDYDTAKSMLDGLKTLVEKGQSIDSRLQGVASISNIESSLRLIATRTGVEFDE